MMIAQKKVTSENYKKTGLASRSTERIPNIPERGLPTVSKSDRWYLNCS